MRILMHQVDFCVIGGGLAGICAAISAARHGAKVAIMHDRPVFGGNASSEVRMWVCGAHGDDNRETGILEEIAMENLYRNPDRNYSIWDSVLYEKVRFEPNITLLMNCSCTDATMEGDRIESVKGWQLTTQTWHIVKADLFADCSGDSILAPLSGAEFRMGREAASEYGESIEPEKADDKTMGMSCLIQARETGRPQAFIPPAWANVYASDEDLPYRSHNLRGTNYWWIELGGDGHSIHDTEELRDELLKVAFGVWDHVKNRGEHNAENWVLDWVGFLPGKRESRRYIGDHVLTQNDVRSMGPFDDTVAYGGWSMDDHHPGGMAWAGQPTIFHPAPSPYPIPYRCLYSKNIVNLFCAGRNISVTHAAMSSTRVMATCALLGQAVGTAAAVAVRYGLTPRGVYLEKMAELQSLLMDDDCHLPGMSRNVPKIAREACLRSSAGDPEPLRNGYDRPMEGTDNGWKAPLGEWVEYEFKEPTEINGLRLVFDSHLNRRDHNMPCYYPLGLEAASVPGSMLRDFRIDGCDGSGDWFNIREVRNNRHRLVKLETHAVVKKIRLIPEATWGFKECHIFSWDVK